MITEATSLPQGVSTDSFSKLINETMFHLPSELFISCPSKRVSSISCQHRHSFFSVTAPVDLSNLLRVYSSSRQLHSSDLRTLRIPYIKTFGHCSFSYAASYAWNSLLCEIRHIQSTAALKTTMKTHLFNPASAS